MGDRLLSWPIKADVGVADSKAKGSQVVDSSTIGWTDEKHIVYLNSLEASFVHHLYSSGDPLKDFLVWPTRTQKETDLSRSNGNYFVSGQFKVLHKRRCENLKLVKTKAGIDDGNEVHHVAAIPWIRHFRSSANGKDLHVGIADDCQSAIQSIPVEKPHSVRETSSRQLPSFCQIQNPKYLFEVTEVSDQNFINKEVEGWAESSRACKKKRSETPAADMLSNKLLDPESHLQHEVQVKTMIIQEEPIEIAV